MGITLERGRFVAAAVVLAVGFGLAGPWLAAQQGAAATGSWPQFRGPNRDGKSADTNLLKQWDADGPALAWKVSGLGTGYSSLSIGGDRLFTMGDLEGSQYVIALSATDGKQLWKAKVGPIWQDRYPGPRATPTVDGALIYSLGHRGRPGVPRGGDRQGALAQEPAARLRRPGHVGLEVRRVAAHRRRPRRGDPRRPGRRDRGAEQDHRRDDLEGEDPDRRPGWSRRRRLRVGRHLERRGRQAVRAVARPWRCRDPRLGRGVPLGLQQGRERHRQHPDADRAGRLRLRRRRATRPAARCSSWRLPQAAR